MTQQKTAKVAEAPGAETTPKTNPVDKMAVEIKNTQNDLQKRLQVYGVLNQKVNQRATLQLHKDTLESFQVPTPINPFDENKKGLDGIWLQTEKGNYDIKNPTLLERVRVFLISEIETRTKQLEVEILEAQF